MKFSIGRTKKSQEVELEINLKIDNGLLNLSMSASIWQTDRRDIAAGGQMYDTLLGEIHRYTNGWTEEKVSRIIEIWKQYHLNDMRPECEHQRAKGFREWAKRKIDVKTWKLQRDVLLQARDIEQASVSTMKKTGMAKISDEDRFIMNLPYEVKTFGDQPDPDQKHYQIRMTESKTLGWITSEEHPDGLLGRPCTECGYRYGHAWKREEIPAEIVNELLALYPSDLREGYRKQLALPAVIS